MRLPSFCLTLCFLAMGNSPSFTSAAGNSQPLKGYFDFSPTAREAYAKIIRLRFDEANTALEVLQQKEEGNLIRIFLQHYLDFLTVCLDDQPADFERFSHNLDKRLDQISRGDRNSPYYLFCQAEMRLHGAMARGRRENFLSALSDAKQGYALLEENQRRFPDFVANKKSLGLLHALVANVPDDYKWAVKGLGGMSGSIEQGRRELEEVVAYARQHDFVFEEEATLGYALVLLMLDNNEDRAWQVLQGSSRLQAHDNPLAALALASLASKTGRNDEAIRILEQCPVGPVFHPLPYRDLQLGQAKLCRLDVDAHVPLENFIRQFKGETGIKEAYQKLAWYHLVNDNEPGYRSYLGYAKLKGKDRSEPDKAALREANSAELPDLRLLRARLLFDGGYYQRAYDLLKNAGGDYSGQRRFALEWTYRMGRITHELGRSAEAVKFYTQAISAGAKEPWHFACNAALQLGLLYEDKKDFNNARTAFQRCLELQPKDYAASLHGRAKAGLNRLKGK